MKFIQHIKMRKLEKRVKKIIVKLWSYHPDVVTGDANFIEDLTADSLDLVDLITVLENEFSLNIPDDKWEETKTVRDAVKLIADLQKRNRNGQTKKN